LLLKFSGLNVFINSLKMLAGELGFEPRLTESEPANNH
jgi:hypothetical protein